MSPGEGWPSTQRWLVSGRVQGVGFRYFVVGSAKDCGVAGDVRNLPDGRVEIRVCGAVKALRDLMAHVRSGPGHARVDAVEVEAIEAFGSTEDFTIRF